MRYHLRTLLIVLAIGPVVLAFGWFGIQRVQQHYRRIELDKRIDREPFVRIWEGTVTVEPEPNSP